MLQKSYVRAQLQFRQNSCITLELYLIPCNVFNYSSISDRPYFLVTLKKGCFSKQIRDLDPSKKWRGVDKDRFPISIWYSEESAEVADRRSFVPQNSQ